MAIETVPSGDKRCGWCGDPEDRSTRFMCEDCFKKHSTDSAIEMNLMFEKDPKGRHWLDRRPDDPDQN